MSEQGTEIVEEINVDVTDLKLMLQIIDVANKNGLIDPGAFIPVGLLYQKLTVAAKNMKVTAETLLTE